MNVVLEKLENLAEIGSEWKNLEKNSGSSFFTSWLWMETWLETLPEELSPYVLRIESKDSLVGLAIVFKRHVKRQKFIGSNALFINTTGDPEYDEITMEYNSILSAENKRDACHAALIDYIEENPGKYDEVYFDGCLDVPESSSNSTRIVVNTYQDCYAVDLEKIRQDDSEYIGKISSNTRYQIRRSIKAYEKIGELRIEEAKTKEDAIDYLLGLRDLHQSYWEEKGEPGSFSNEYFSKFHNCLVNKRFDPKIIQLLKISAGTEVVGYLYNYLYRGYVYNYQSGFNYGVVRKYNKPGLVSHYLAINHNLKLGARSYEFMAGEVQYKKSMGTEIKRMAWAVIQRKRFIFLLESNLKIIRKLFSSKM